jgi:myo-inositol-1-phosphate synthase
MHVDLGGYHIADIEVVAAFDVDAAKVGEDLGKAIWAGQNNTVRFADVEDLGVAVQRGPTLDGLGKYYREVVEESPAPAVDVAGVLRETEADVLPGGEGRLCQCHTGLHRQRPGVGPEVLRRPCADHR